VYAGTDPSNVATFNIIGRWYVGRVPVGRRFMSKYGGDLAIICSNGIERMSQLTEGRGLDTPGVELGNTENWLRYMETISRTVRENLNNPYFRFTFFPAEQAIIVTTPRNNAQDSLQFIFGTLSGGWSEFIGVPMLSVEAHDGELYFGTLDGKVMQAFFGDTDDSLSDGTPGVNVMADLQTAFVAVGKDLFHTKRMIMGNPMFLAPNAPNVKARINTDWSFQQVPGSPPYVINPLALWDQALWDQALWAGEGNNFQAWFGAEGLGTHASLRMTFTGASGTIFTGWKLVVETGRGVL
jgi:hypothetical protein